MNQIANAEWIEHKTKLVQEMNNVEAQNYEQLYDQIKDEIRKADEDIRQTKEELVQARKVRRNRMEYDAMA
jgi:THO complex subunit 7